MSKFLKFIVSLILIIFIGSGAALIVPQFVGDLDTVIVQDGMVSNKMIGTVIYSKKEAASNMQVGDKIVDMDAGTLYVHEVVSYDSVTQTAQVTGGPATTVRISDAFTRAVFSVPLIGYLMIATQSLPGLILLGLLLALVILLFISSEVVRHPSDDDDDDEDVFSHSRDDDDDFYRSLAERKRQTEELGSVPNSVADSVSRIVAEEQDQPEMPKGLFSDESDELYRADRANRLKEETAGEAARSANGMLDLSGDAAPVDEVPGGKEEKPLGTGELPDVQTALEAALENQQLSRPERPKNAAQQLYAEKAFSDEPPVPDENGEIELAMPVHTAEELISKAYAEGLDPVVKEDKTNGVTFVDYSDTL